MAIDEKARREMGARISELRDQLRLKQQEIADYCHVSVRMYQFWQAGENTPEADHLHRLAEILQTTPQYILRGNTPDPFANTNATGDGATDGVAAAAAAEPSNAAAQLELIRGDIAALSVKLDEIAADSRAERRQILGEVGKLAQGAVQEAAGNFKALLDDIDTALSRLSPEPSQSPGQSPQSRSSAA